MPLDVLNVLFGAGAALVAREAVDARKLRRKLWADDDALLRAIKQELAETRETALLNLVALWDRKDVEWVHRHHLHWETKIDPLAPLSARLDDLMRREGSYDLLGNAHVVRLFSGVARRATHIALLDAQRIRFVAAQYRARVVQLDRKDVVERIERWEERLLQLHVELLSAVLHLQAIVVVIESDRLMYRRSRVRFGTFYEPSDHDWAALEELLRENESFEFSSMSGGGSSSRFPVLEEFGLAEMSTDHWVITARGRLTLGSGVRVWHRPRSSDASEERIDWTNFDPVDWL